MSFPQNTIVTRERILAHLRPAVQAHPLVVLIAPVGYGKTIAARELISSFSVNGLASGSAAPSSLSSNAFAHCCYLPIYPGEGVAAYLWEHHCALLAKLGSPLAPVMRRFSFPAALPQCIRFTEEARTVLEDSPHLFVLDDYHFLQSQKYNVLLETIARAAIPDSSFLVLSRVRPDLPLEELNIKGACAIYDQDLLTFTEADTVRLYNGYGIPDRNVASKAWETSEGWGAALWLHAQQFLAHGTLAPDNNFHQLLHDTAFSGYSEADQQLLLKLSILDSFTLEQAAMVTQETGLTQRIFALHQNNAFLHYLPETDSYRMHNLFRSFCSEQFEALPAECCDKAILYRNAAEWNLLQNDHVGAVYYLAKAGRDEDLERILEIHEETYARGMLHIDADGMGEIVLAIPWHVRLRRPLGYLSFVFSYTVKASWQEGLKLLEEAEKLFSQTAFSPKLAQRIAGHLAFVKGVLSSNDLRGCLLYMQQAWDLLGEPVSLYNKNILSTYGSPHFGFTYLRDKGNYSQLVHESEAGWRTFVTLSNGCAAGTATLMQAELLLETGQLAQACIKAEQAVVEAEMKEHIPTILGGYFTLARIYLATKRVADALQAIDKMKAYADQSTHFMIPCIAELIQAYVHVCLGKTDAIPAWIADGDLNFVPAHFHGLTLAYVVQGKLLLVHKDYLKLLGVAKWMRAEYSLRNYLLGELHTLALEAIASWHIYGPEPTLPLLDELMEKAKPDGLYFLLGEYGEHILPLITLRLKELPDDTFAKCILDQANAYAALDENQVRKNIRVRKLTQREKKMLDLVAQGKSSMQIAKAFGVQRVTVTKALGNAYRKLGVKNRSQAVRKLVE